MPLPVETTTTKNCPECFRFGEFRCDPVDRVLYRGDDPVPLPPKAVQTLLLLLRNAPRLVEKEELLKEIWPDTFVEEGNLTHNISLLRKTLGTNGNGKGYIETVPRRGYRFAGSLKTAETPNDVPSAAAEEPGALPQPTHSPRAYRLWRGLITVVLFLVAISLWYQRTESSVAPPPAKGGTRNPAAYQEYLNGRLFYTSHDPKSLERAVAAFERAVQLDRGYAAAYAGLAEAYFLLGQNRSSATAFARTSAAAHTALELDPNLPQANAILGFGEALTLWHWVEGEKHIRRAIELDPGYTQAHVFLSIVLMREGRTPEALQEAQNALAAEPFHDALPWLFTNIYYYDRQYGTALEWVRKGESRGVGFGSLQQMEAIIQTLQGQCNPALRSLSGTPQESREQLGTHGYVLARCGRTAEALTIKQKLRATKEADGATTAYFLSMIEVGLGNNRAAVRQLEIAQDGSSGYLPRIKTEPIFDPLHSDPGFQRLVSSIGLGEPLGIGK